jgi:hypothetical protein
VQGSISLFVLSIDLCLGFDKELYNAFVSSLAGLHEGGAAAAWILVAGVYLAVNAIHKVLDILKMIVPNFLEK